MAHLRIAVVLVIIAAEASVAADAERAASKVTHLSAPQPKPQFDPVSIDRTLAEPTYASPRPLYRFLAFGPQGRQILAMVADAAGGEGKPYDTYYIDLDLDRDLTSPNEKFRFQNDISKIRVCPKGDPDKGLIAFPIASREALIGYGKYVDLQVKDAVFEYAISPLANASLVRSRCKDGSWFTEIGMFHQVGWSDRKAMAPVFRFGGRELDLAHENIGKAPRDFTCTVGSTLPLGKLIRVQGNRPFFAGSSMSVGEAGGWGYVHGAYSGMHVRCEFIRDGRTMGIDVPFQACCGGVCQGGVRLSHHFPDGPFDLVVRMETGAYLGTLVKRIGYRCENPLAGEPVAPLAVTLSLSAAHPDDTVVELYREANVPALGVDDYDGVRDVFFGNQKINSPYGKVPSTNLGTGLWYSREMRYELILGGEIEKGCVALIKYDLSMLPPGAEVAKALLVMTLDHVTGTDPDLTCRAYALKKPFSEELVGLLGPLKLGNDPKQKMRFPVGEEILWDEPYLTGIGDRHSESVAETVLPRTREPTLVRFDVTDTVQNWASGKWANHGLLLEMARPTKGGAYGTVFFTASDWPVDPRQRPALVLVLDGKIEPVGAGEVASVNADLAAARTQAVRAGKPLLVTVLSAGSVTSRNLAAGVLRQATVQDFVARHFVEARIDGNDATHKDFLARYGVERAPTSLVIDTARGAEEETWERIEPFAWNALFGRVSSCFEFGQTYTAALQGALDDLAADRRLVYSRHGELGILRSWSHLGGKTPSGGFCRLTQK